MALRCSEVKAVNDAFAIAAPPRRPVLNYRHAFHAGNFADVHKHALLVSLVEYLKRKDKPFRVIDTHAGRGRYDLASDEATRTGEQAEGIARLLTAPTARAPELKAYLDVVRAEPGT